MIDFQCYINCFNCNYCQKQPILRHFCHILGQKPQKPPKTPNCQKPPKTPNRQKPSETASVSVRPKTFRGTASVSHLPKTPKPTKYHFPIFPQFSIYPTLYKFLKKNRVLLKFKKNALHGLQE